MRYHRRSRATGFLLKTPSFKSVSAQHRCLQLLARTNALPLVQLQRSVSMLYASYLPTVCLSLPHHRHKPLPNQSKLPAIIPTLGVIWEKLMLRIKCLLHHPWRSPARLHQGFSSPAVTLSTPCTLCVLSLGGAEDEVPRQR